MEGTGTLTAVQTDGNLSIDANGLNFPAQSSPSWGDQYARSGAHSRAAGKVLLAGLNLSTIDSGINVGWAKTASLGNIATFEAAVNFSDTPLVIARYKPGQTSGQAVIATPAESTDYELALVLRATGGFYLIKGGAFSTWTLLWVEPEGSTATLYAGVSNYDCVGDVSTLRIPDLTYTPTPIASDSFDRGDSSDLGSTDGDGAEESGGSGLAWSEGGTLEISSNKMGVASNGTVLGHVDSSEADVVIQAEVTTGDGTNDFPALMLRYVDSNNFWLAMANNKDNKHEIFENTGGTFTSRASAAKTLVNNTAYDMLAVADDETITSYIDGGTRISYGSAAANKTATNHGVRLWRAGNAIDDFVVWPRTLPAADQATLDSI